MSDRTARATRRAVAAWAATVMCVACIPFLPGLTGTRIFYVRDLSMFFWGRHVWLRRALLSGSFPMWDPYAGAGQSAVADALHQLFLPPAVILRLLGSEVLGFNLWVAAPFPIAALGAWLFLRRRFSASASALGAIACAVSGPLLSTFNFPNLSWSAAATPWVLYAVDRAAARRSLRSAAPLAIAVAFQALAGEPVTLLATLVLAAAFAAVIGTPASAAFRDRARIGAVVGLGFALGIAISAIQLVPLGEAATLSQRSATIGIDFWSIHPLELLETVSLHLYGDYYAVRALQFAPWLRVMNGGREPFLLSIYFGVPLLTLAVFGLVAGWRTRWGLFWTAAGLVSVVFALGGHSPVYPFIRDHVAPLRSFRFPAKYLVLSSIVIAAAAAAGWDALVAFFDADDRSSSRHARVAALAFPAAIGAAAGAVAAFCMYLPQVSVWRLFALANHLHVEDGVEAAAFMLQTLPRAASLVLAMSVATIVLMHLATARPAAAGLARAALCGLIVADLLVHAWGLSPAFDPSYLAQPAWLSSVKAHPDSRFYIGGKRDGTLDPSDLDSGGAYLNHEGLTGSASRAALSGQADFYPSAWQAREMLSYDLPVLWPKEFNTMTTRFLLSGRGDRDRFLDVTGVRFRVLPRSQVLGQAPITAVPYLLNSFLYDFGDRAAPRVAVVPRARVEPDVGAQIEALFDKTWNERDTVLIDRDGDAAGNPGPAVQPAARIVDDTANRVVVDASVTDAGGYLLLLDSYSTDWTASADGQPASLLRADGMFRAVRLRPGRHRVEFVYRPRAFRIGVMISTIAVAMLCGLLFWPSRRTEPIAGPR
jgi:hypothetical protein